MTPVHYPRLAAVGHSFMEQTYLKCNPTVLERFVIIHLRCGESKGPSCDPAPFAFPYQGPGGSPKSQYGHHKVNVGTRRPRGGIEDATRRPERAHDVRLPLRRKIVEMWTLHCITVVTITRQCHEAAAVYGDPHEQTSKS